MSKICDDGCECCMYVGEGDYYCEAAEQMVTMFSPCIVDSKEFVDDRVSVRGKRKQNNRRASKKR